MYVTGRNQSGTGTILSSLFQSAKDGLLEEVVVVSPRPSSAAAVAEARERIAKLLQVDVKTSFYALQDHSIADLHAKLGFAAAIISVPDHLHHMYGRQCLELGLPTLMVKPLTPTVQEAEDLIAFAAAQNTFACVEFHKRYDETNLWIKKAIAEDKIGKINYITVDYSQRIHIPRDTFKGWSDQTNIFQYLGVHYVDLIYFLTGFVPVRVSATGINGILKAEGINSPDAVTAQLVWVSPKGDGQSFVSTFNTNWIDPNCSSALSDQKYKVIGTHGRLECDQKNRGLEWVSEQAGIQQVNPYFSDYLPAPDGGLAFSGYGHKSIQTFISDVRDLRAGAVKLEDLNALRPTFAASLVSVAATEAVNESMKADGAWVNIDLK